MAPTVGAIPSTAAGDSVEKPDLTGSAPVSSTKPLQTKEEKPSKPVSDSTAAVTAASETITNPTTMTATEGMFYTL